MLILSFAIVKNSKTLAMGLSSLVLIFKFIAALFNLAFIHNLIPPEFNSQVLHRRAGFNESNRTDNDNTKKN